jgi:tetraprenyl-beta-curcumene synthase
MVFDYLDLLAEQPTPDPIRNGRRLHQALLTAVDPQAEHVDYYAHHALRADGGYVRALVSACRGALKTLPSHPLIIESLRQASGRIVAYQSYNHGDAHGSRRAFEEWAQAEVTAHRARHPAAELTWWELAAAAGSSMPVFAVIAAATNPALSLREVHAIERAYYPKIAALNSLLDSLVDQQEDIALRQNQLLGYYHAPQEAISRLHAITVHAMQDTEQLPRAGGHTLILAALVGFYLHTQRAAYREGLLNAIGGLAAPTMLVFRARDAVGAAKRSHQRH